VPLPPAASFAALALQPATLVLALPQPGTLLRYTMMVLNETTHEPVFTPAALALVMRVLPPPASGGAATVTLQALTPAPGGAFAARGDTVAVEWDSVVEAEAAPLPVPAKAAEYCPTSPPPEREEPPEREVEGEVEPGGGAVAPAAAAAAAAAATQPPVAATAAAAAANAAPVGAAMPVGQEPRRGRASAASRSRMGVGSVMRTMLGGK
jgi:hypothetical protein